MQQDTEQPNEGGSPRDVRMNNFFADAEALRKRSRTPTDSCPSDTDSCPSDSTEEEEEEALPEMKKFEEKAPVRRRSSLAKMISLVIDTEDEVSDLVRNPCF